MVSNPWESRDSIYTVTVYLRIPFPSVFISGCTTIQEMRIPLSAFTTFLLYPWLWCRRPLLLQYI